MYDHSAKNDLWSAGESSSRCCFLTGITVASQRIPKFLMMFVWHRSHALGKILPRRRLKQYCIRWCEFKATYVKPYDHEAGSSTYVAHLHIHTSAIEPIAPNRRIGFLLHRQAWLSMLFDTQFRIDSRGEDNSHCLIHFKFEMTITFWS